MFPYKTSIVLHRNHKQALYLQLANQFIKLIKDRKLLPKTKLPGSRTLAALLYVHRKTVVACYEELLLQGWVESIPKKGTFVHASLPELKLQSFTTSSQLSSEEIGFSFYKDKSLAITYHSPKGGWLYINDGISDVRLTPREEIAKTYRRIMGRKHISKEMAYGTTLGNERLRETLSKYLNETRGLHTTKENILVTRGSQMGIYLATQVLLEENDIVIVGETNYSAADTTFLHHKAQLKRVGVDEHGLVTSEIEAICKQTPVKLIYVTSHHHHPTTVTLSAERRIHLLNLAKQYRFAIVEDDYDYDFNYQHSPILPLASHDIHGNVIYIGSVCKTVAPVFRVGYLVAHESFVEEVSHHRRFIDRQGDAILELTFEEFIKNGDLDRHIKKVMKIYKNRKELFCSLFQKEFSEFFSFQIPKGGMAIWAKLNPKFSWEMVAAIGKKYKLGIGDWQRYDLAKKNHNCIRIGFASYNEEEIRELLYRFKKTMVEVKNILGKN